MIRILAGIGFVFAILSLGFPLYVIVESDLALPLISWLILLILTAAIVVFIIVPLGFLAFKKQKKK